MRRSSIFSVLFVLAVLFIGLGFYRGWFVLSSHQDKGKGNQVDVNLRVDADKAKADAELVKSKTEDLAERAADRVAPSDEDKTSK